MNNLYINVFNGVRLIRRQLEWTISVIPCNPPCNYGNTRFLLILLKLKSDLISKKCASRLCRETINENKQFKEIRYCHLCMEDHLNLRWQSLEHYASRQFLSMLIDWLIDCLIDWCRMEGKIGSPEKPLSDLGLLSYRAYWKVGAHLKNGIKKWWFPSNIFPIVKKLNQCKLETLNPIRFSIITRDGIVEIKHP